MMRPSNRPKAPSSKIKAPFTLGGVGLGTFGLLGMLVYHPFVGQDLAQASNRSAQLPEGFVWGVSWHPERLHDVPGGYAPQLKDAQDLGAGLLRFDVHWNRMQPHADRALDPSGLPDYRQLVEDARKRGFQVKVNLGGYPAWAVTLAEERPEEFFRRYRPYVRAVVEALGPSVDYYQMGNEFNTILDPIPAALDARVFREARTEIDRGKATWPHWKVKTVINACDTFYIPWRGQLERVLDEASSSIDVIGYDFYPGNYSHVHDWGAWHTLEYLGSLMQRYDKDGAICETGCPAFLGEGRQARWITRSAGALREAIARSPVRDRFRFAVFYELADDPHFKAWPPPTENTFGLVAHDGRRKPGFAAYRRIIQEGE